jgi:rhodanese-related sulfurtransferase
MPTTQTISPQQAAQQIGSKLFIDVRTPAEYQEVHIEGTISHPLSELNAQGIQTLLAGKAGGIIVCRSGGRARQAFDKLTSGGVSDLAVLEGGVTAWEGAGLPVVRGRKTISLERQVRIAAGALVLVGSLLSYCIHPGFIAVPAFVGAGLVFAGATDTCGMGMLLARMPWNTRGATKATCCSSQSGTTSCATK